MKKIFSIALAVVMLFSIMSVCVSAETPATTYTGKASIMIAGDNSLNPENFEISLALNNHKLGALDGASTEFTYTLDKVENPFGVSYFTNPEEFFAFYTDEEFTGSSIEIEFTVELVSDEIFGQLDYIITIKGFSAPLDAGIDLGILGGLIGGGDDSADISAKLPTDIVYNGTIEGVPTIDTSTIQILGRPEKSDYYDSEKFDATGLKLAFSLSNGKNGTFTYNEANAHMFSFIPTTNENLTCYDSEVSVFIFGTYIMNTPISVEHKWSCDAEGNPAYVNITTDKYSDNKPGYHAIVCEGCGETHDAQPHTVDPNAWTYNNDQTFVANGTESNTCLDCGTVLIRDTFGTAGFNTTFADMHFIKVIFEYINVLFRFIGAATY